MSALVYEHSKRTRFQHIWVITGPAGCGKTTICQYLQNELEVPYLEGDDVRWKLPLGAFAPPNQLRKEVQTTNLRLNTKYHSKPNKDKMNNGVPLTDEDRWDWLIALRKAAIDAVSPTESNNFHPPIAVVVSCSALKGKYRDAMRVAVYGSPYIKIHFIYLKLNEETLMQRVTQREAHYMKSNMVRSQLQALEEPQGEWDVVTINVDGSQEQVCRRVLYSVCSNLKDGS